MLSSPRHLLTAVAASIGLLAASAAFAQPMPAQQPPSQAGTALPPGPPAHPPVDGRAGHHGAPPPDAAGVAGAATSVTGHIARWLPNPNGDVDGWLLDDGTQVAFPPHLSARVLAAFKLHDSVEVTGRRGPQGGVLRAAALRNVSSGQSVSDVAAGSPPPAPKPPAHDPSALTAMTSEGRIATLLHTGRGDVNGVVLDDGTVVRFPPHVGQAMAGSLKAGGPLFATGFGTRGAQGNAFEATRLGTSASDAQAVFAGPPHGPHAASGPDGHGPDGHGQGHGPKPPPVRPDAASAPR